LVELPDHAAPGIVIAVGSMITTVINKLGEEFARATTLAPESAVGIQALPEIINIKDVIPGFYLQLVIGIYVIQIGIILTILSSGIEKGIDRLSEKNLIGKNILISTILYVLISTVGIIIFSLLASGISNINTA
jgi:choline-glycine betaine transporter